MICCHVDDFLHAGDNNSFDMLIKKYEKDFLLPKLTKRHLNT